MKPRLLDLFCGAVMRVAIYCRVSTDEQDTQNQLVPILTLCGQRGFEVYKVYQESASAWKNGHQKELRHLFEDARRGKFQKVVVWSLDRLTREGPLVTLQYFKKFNDYGVSVLSLHESWTEAPTEVMPLLLALIGWVAEQSSKRQSERTKAGMERARKEGKHLGRPRK